LAAAGLSIALISLRFRQKHRRPPVRRATRPIGTRPRTGAPV